MFDPKTRILVVDDMMMMRKHVSKECAKLGFTDITQAGDGIKAWEAIVSASPSFGLIISDWNMPNCTGIDLLRRVRADSRFGKIPFLMVTAEAEQHQIMEAVKAGVSNYVIKPFDAAMLKDRLEAVYRKLAA